MEYKVDVSNEFFGHRDVYKKPIAEPVVVSNSGGGRGYGGGRNRGSTLTISVYIQNSFLGGRGGRSMPIRIDDSRKPSDSLNLDQFLAETTASEIRKIHKKS